MCEGGVHWALSSAAGLLLTGRYRPLCSVVYEAPNCSARSAFLRAADWLFAEERHCQRIACTYRLGRTLRD